MNKRKKSISLILYFFCTVTLICAQTAYSETISSLNELYDAKTLDVLQKQEKIIYIPNLKKGENIKYFPKTPMVLEALDRWSSEKQTEPTFVIEALYLIDKPITEKNSVNTEKTAKIMTAISTMKGISYYSATLKKNEVLYEESYVIDSYEKQKKIEDPVYKNVDGKKIWIKQKDNTYGEYIMEMDYAQKENEISFYMFNKNPLKVLFFNAVDKEKIHIFLHTLDIKTHIISYLVIRAEYFDTPLFNNIVEKSLYTRMDAICKWFKESYNDGG